MSADISTYLGQNPDKYIVNTLIVTFHAYSLTMLGKVQLRRNDFLSFQTERCAMVEMRLVSWSGLYSAKIDAAYILEVAEVAYYVGDR